jgi:threonine dehydrogenase-like Zn-dependent dehydrogenase
MKALLFERSLPRFAAARVASGWRGGSGARVGPLRLADIAEPELPGPDWVRVSPRLSGVCGSDLATVDSHVTRYFEPLVSFPFVPGHEVAGDLDDGSRVVVEPLLHCVVRGIDPLCPACAAGKTNLCRNVAFGHLHPGAQTGYCADTGGGWGAALVAHQAQLHRVPDGLSDEAAVMVEPTACAIHGALAYGRTLSEHATAVVIGAGTLGLCTVAALARHRDDIETLVAVAKHPEQRRLARDLGATTVVEPGELPRAVRRRTGSLVLDSGQLTGGATIVYDCVGTSQSLASALAVIEPGGTIVLLGMPGDVKVDLTGLWQREVSITGAYAYGTEAAATTAAGRTSVPAPPRRTFDLAFELVANTGLERLVSALYPLDRYREAISHAAAAGRRGAVKVAFDQRRPKRRGRATSSARPAPEATSSARPAPEATSGALPDPARPDRINQENS